MGWEEALWWGGVWAGWGAIDEASLPPPTVMQGGGGKGEKRCSDIPTRIN